jgi:hypothetical protein
MGNDLQYEASSPAPGPVLEGKAVKIERGIGFQLPHFDSSL